MTDEERWREIGKQLRVNCVRSIAAAGSGHIPSSLSAADLMAVLLDKYLRYDFAAPQHPRNDHLIFSKGHAAPLLYAMYEAAGAIDDDELLTLRQFGSRLEGHPTPRLPWVEVATGSLGQGFPIAVGMALGGKRFDHRPSRVWVLCGDGEMAEGSIWEAFQTAAQHGLDNLTVIVDFNRLGQTGRPINSGRPDSLADRAQAFGWHTIVADGHDVRAIDEAYAQAVATADRPTVIIARTVKGKGVACIEDKSDAHSKPLSDPAAAIEELGGRPQLRVRVTPPDGDPTPRQFKVRELELPRFQIGELVSPRQAHGRVLCSLGDSREDIVVIDADMANSTCADLFARLYPDRFLQMNIAEQQMVAAAVGLQALGYRPFACTFAAFLLRAYEFVRMAAVSCADLRLVGSHPGVSIGWDGPSQMALEDIAAFRAVQGSTVLYPSDANQTAQLLACMAERNGISYLRMTRADLPVLYGPDERFQVGGSRVVRSSKRDDVTIVAAGITLHEALKAVETLSGEGIHARVIDLYSVKPVDTETLRLAARETDGRVITVEDHCREGGLGDAVVESLCGVGLELRAVKLAVEDIPGSGSPQQLLNAAGISANRIVEAARTLA